MKRGQKYAKAFPTRQVGPHALKMMPAAGFDHRRGKPCPLPTPSYPLESPTQVRHAEGRTTSHAFWFPCHNLLHFSATGLCRTDPVLTSADSAHSNVLLAHLSRVHQCACKRGKGESPTTNKQIGKAGFPHIFIIAREGLGDKY